MLLTDPLRLVPSLLRDRREMDVRRSVSFDGIDDCDSMVLLPLLGGDGVDRCALILFR